MKYIFFHVQNKKNISDVFMKIIIVLLCFKDSNFDFEMKKNEFSQIELIIFLAQLEN